MSLVIYMFSPYVGVCIHCTVLWHSMYCAVTMQKYHGYDWLWICTSHDVNTKLPLNLIHSMVTQIKIMKHTSLSDDIRHVHEGENAKHKKTKWWKLSLNCNKNIEEILLIVGNDQIVLTMKLILKGCLSRIMFLWQGPWLRAGRQWFSPATVCYKHDLQLLS